MIQQLPNQEWSANSLVPAVEASICTGKQVYVVGIIISNVTVATDATLTLKDGDGVLKVKTLVPAGSISVPLELSDIAWAFSNGVSWSCDQASALSAYIFGVKRA